MTPELTTRRWRYTKNCPDFKKPTIIGAIDLKNLKFARNMHDRDVNYNLYHMIDDEISTPSLLDPKMDEFLVFLKDNKMRWNITQSTSLEDAKFIINRGDMTVIMSTPYEYREPWIMAVLLFKGNIYICPRVTEKKKKDTEEATEYQKKSTAGGFKFEQYVFSESPDKDPNPDVPIDECGQFNCIFRSQLNKHTIVYEAEIDGVACDGDVQSPPVNASMDTVVHYLSQLEFVEAKTNLHLYDSPENRGPRIIFKRSKAGKWWCQSFLSGINRIICGFKNRQGIVEKVKILKLEDIKKISEWNFNVCINFLDAFLTHVKDCLSYVITRDFGEAALNNIQLLDLVTLTLEWTPPSNVVVMTDSWNNTDDVILPDWYTSSFKDCCQPPWL